MTDHKQTNLPVYLYVALSVGTLIGRILDIETLNYIFKPTLMPCLALMYFLQTENKRDLFSRLILTALGFSWFGDVMLMFEDRHPLFFMLGLGGFLIAHVLYIFAYRESVKNDARPSLFKTKPYLFIPTVAIGIGMYLFLFPSLGELKIPVFFYCLAIVYMSVFALNRYGRTSGESFRLIFIGALIFMVSDACIATDKFLVPIPFAGFWIMITYINAQYLIVLGAARK